MCDCQLKFDKYGSLFEPNKAEKERHTKRLPQLLEKRKKILAKPEKHYMEKTADTVFLNGKIYTMNQKEEVVTAVAIQGQNIISVGSLFDVLPLVREDTHFVDLQGKTLLPGFIDPHIHMHFSMNDDWVDVGPFVNKTMAEAKQKLKQAIKNAKKGDWIRAKLFDPTITPNKEQFDYSRWGIDKITQELGMAHMGLCIYLLQANGHIAHVNTQALHVYKIDQNTQIPFGKFVKNQKGELTGQLQQAAVLYMQNSLFPQDDSSFYERNFRNFLKHSTTKGITSLHDCGIGHFDGQVDLSILYSVFSPQENPLVRYSGQLVSTKWNLWIQDFQLQPDYKSPLLRIKGIKCWSDGSLQGGSGYLRQPYLKSEWKVGLTNFSTKQLYNSIELAQQRGWQVGVHGNGDAGIDQILDAFQGYSQNNTKVHDFRNRIEHCTFIHREQLQRMKKLRIYPSFLIGHVYYYGEVFQKEILGEERANKIDPVKSAIELGLRPTIHSDYGCQPLDPIRCIYNAVTRIMRNTIGDKVLNENECVTPYEAIKAMTIDAAWQSHIDDIVGSIQVGKKADFVILDRDPLAIPSKELINLKVVQTWMNGRVTYKNLSLKSANFADLLTSLKKKKHDHVEHSKKEEAHHH